MLTEINNQQINNQQKFQNLFNVSSTDTNYSKKYYNDV